MNIEQVIIKNLRKLPLEKQQDHSPGKSSKMAESNR